MSAADAGGRGAAGWEQMSVLVTGGTGSFGAKFVEAVLAKHPPQRLIVYSRDELKQSEMQAMLRDESLRFFIGDVRDRDRLERAMRGVDVVVHAAALKQVPACEYNPFEAVKTNVMGAQNVIDAAINQRVKKVLALSTDKAVAPTNLYGATKLCAEKMFVQANTYSGIGGGGTRFSCTRYGNVVGSRGSVVKAFLQGRRNGRLSITDARMTRFWITLEQGVAFVLRCLDQMQGGEIFVPKIPSMRVVDLARSIAPNVEPELIGIRPGEKLHEALVSEDEARNTLELDDMYVIEPINPSWQYTPPRGGRPLADGFRYTSDTNERWLGVDELKISAEESAHADWGEG